MEAAGWPGGEATDVPNEERGRGKSAQLALGSAGSVKEPLGGHFHVPKLPPDREGADLPLIRSLPLGPWLCPRLCPR